MYNPQKNKGRKFIRPCSIYNFRSLQGRMVLTKTVGKPPYDRSGIYSFNRTLKNTARLLCTKCTAQNVYDRFIRHITASYFKLMQIDTPVNLVPLYFCGISCKPCVNVRAQLSRFHDGKPEHWLKNERHTH